MYASSIAKKTISPRRAFNQKVELESNVKPSTCILYNIAPSELAKLQKQLDKLLKIDCIQPLKSPYSAFVLFECNVNESLHMCVNYKVLIKVMVKSKYFIPNATNLFDRLFKVSVFTKLDLC